MREARSIEGMDDSWSLYSDRRKGTEKTNDEFVKPLLLVGLFYNGDLCFVSLRL